MELKIGLVVNRLGLLEELKKLASVISTKTTIPILKTVKITVKDNIITLEGNDTKDIMRVTLYNEEPCNNAVYVMNYKSLVDFLKKSKAENIEIESIDDSQTKIIAGKIKFNISSLSPKEFPLPPTFDSTDITLTKDEFTNALNNTIYASSKSDSRPMLQAVFIKLDKQGLKFVATDSHRLGQYELFNQKSDIEYTASPNAETLKKALKIVGKRCVKVTIGFSEQYTVLKFDNVEYLISNIEGNYPDTSRLIPDDYNTQVTLDVKNLMESLDMMEIIYKENGNNLVTLDCGNKVELFTTNSEENMTAEINSQDFNGDEIKISFNGSFMKEVLKVINNEEVKIHFINKMRPFILKPDFHATHLILPVRTY